MGNKNTQTSPDTVALLNDSYGSDLVRERPPNPKTTCWDFCLKSRFMHLENEAMEWSERTRRYLRKYRKFGWSSRIRILIKPKRNNFQTIQACLISEIIILSQQYEGLNQSNGVLNIQDTQRSRYMAVSMMMIQSNKDQNFQRSKQEKLVSELPQFANSILGEDLQINVPFKKQLSDTSNGVDITARDFYKRTMQIIEGHLNEPNNPLQWFLQAYLKIFNEGKSSTSEIKDSYKEAQLSSRISSASDTPKRVRESRSHTFVEDIKAFIGFYLFSLYTFYNLDKILTVEQRILFTSQNLSSFIMTLLFRNDLLFQQIFNGLQDSNIEETEKFYVNLIAFKDKRPSFFGVPMHLELLPDSIPQLQKDQNQDNLKSGDQSFLVSDCIRRINFSKIEGSKYMEEEEKFEEEPYGFAINQLRKLCMVRSPVHQLKLISKTTEYIQLSINEFYTRNNLKLISNFGADELVPILCYVVVKSQVRDLGTYLKLIENFTPRQSLNSSEGYKLVTLQNCFYQISNWGLRKARDYQDNDARTYSKSSQEIQSFILNRISHDSPQLQL